MKSNFTLLSILLLLVGATTGIAQSKVQFGIQAGSSISSFKISADMVDVNFDSKIGFTAGVLAHINMSENFAVQPALNFVQKGFKQDYGAGDKGTSTLNYLELPINFLYQTAGAGESRLFVGGGPSFGLAMSGKSKDEFSNNSESYDLEIGNGEDDDLKPFELGASLMAGYQLKNGLFMVASWNPGLSNVLPGMEEGAKGKNRNFQIRIGFMF